MPSRVVYLLGAILTTLGGTGALAQGPQPPAGMVGPLSGPPLPAPAPGVVATAPAATALEPQTARPFRVEPGGHLLDHTGSGILGPFQYDQSDRWLDFGIIVQAEYLQNSPSTGQSTEFLFFRRLRPVVMGGFGDWQGVLMMDFGAGQNGDNYASSVRWADLEYTGVYQAHARVGSFKPWFSSELLTLGPHLLGIERSPVGNTEYGNPDYMIGVAWDQMLPGRKFAYYASAGLEDHAQNVNQMSMRSPAYAPTGSNQGWIVTGRLDYMAVGEMRYDPRPLHTPTPSAYNRADFHTPGWRMLVSTAAYGWWNDGTSNPFTVNGVGTSTTQADLDRAFGVEVSSGLRGYGLTVNAEYQYVRGELLDPTFTGGLYVGGGTNLHKVLVDGGYMLPHDVEPVVGWSAVDASGFRRALSVTAVGVNWYVRKYAIRFAANYNFVNNNNGVPGSNVGVTRVLAQFVW